MLSLFLVILLLQWDGRGCWAYWLGGHLSKKVVRSRRSALAMCMGTMDLRIATRATPLAMAQAEELKQLIVNRFRLYTNETVQIQPIVTRGDTYMLPDVKDLGLKKRYVKEMEDMLFARQTDICVHSMKDVPFWLEEGTVIPCYLPREASNDVFVSNKYRTIEEVPKGATIATNSLRRKAQLLAFNKHFRIVEVHGHMLTRLKCLDNGDFDATLFSLSSMIQMGLQDRIETSQILPWSIMLPAPAQGIVGVQCLEKNVRMCRLLEKLNHAETEIEAKCERAFMAGLQGRCGVPVAGQAIFDELSGNVGFLGFISRADGSGILRIHREGPASDSHTVGVDAGLEVQGILGNKKLEAYVNTYAPTV